jgi:uncharacterized protein DUF1353
MGRFIGRIQIQQNPENAREWYVCVPFAYEIDSQGFGGVYRIQVHKGFVTDGASIPRILWPVLSPFGRHFKAAAIHDVLWRDPEVPFRNANAVFYEAMRDCNVNWLRANLLWLGVTLNGMRLELMSQWRA